MGQPLDLVRVFEDEHGSVEQHIDPVRLRRVLSRTSTRFVDQPVVLRSPQTSILLNAATPTPAPAPPLPVPSSRPPSVSAAPPPPRAQFPTAPSTQLPSPSETHRERQSHAGRSAAPRRGTISPAGGGSFDGRAEPRRSATPARLLPVKTEADVVEIESPRRKVSFPSLFFSVSLGSRKQC